MLPSKTVFVVGAGASSEAGLPVGSQLKQEIARKLDFRFEYGYKPIGKGDVEILDLFRRTFPQEVNERLGGCRRICTGLTLSSSIDDFIDAHRHDQLIAECGKVAIASSILEAERRSKLYYKRDHIESTINFEAIEGTWYVALFRLLAQQVARSDLGEMFRNITIVSFNYDRCIEHFLIHAIATNYHLKIEDASPLVEALPILRPFGSVGRYFGRQSVPFGTERLPAHQDIIGNLKTYTEQIEDEASLGAIRGAITKAQVIVFLGNAFHANNMRLLQAGEPLVIPKRVYATRKGISDSDLPVVERQFRNMTGLTQPKNRNLEIHFGGAEEGCAALFDRYRMSLRQ
jgi:hypothetical protein